MKRLRKFISRPGPERRLILRAVFQVIRIRLGLCLLNLRLIPFQRLRRRLSPRRTIPGNAPDRTTALVGRSPSCSPDQICRAVLAACRHLPGASTCLVEALSMKALLEREGYPASLRLGVARDERGNLLAHAWVESRGKTVTSVQGSSAQGTSPSGAGGPGSLTFTPLPVFEDH